MLKLTVGVLVAVLVLASNDVAIAADMKDMKDMNMSKPAAEQAQGIGIVKAVDLQTRTVIIAHEPIKAFDWPAMTMKFKVSDPALLKGIAAGNKVNFTLQGKDMMQSTVTAIKAVH